jgi:hypothetical protein
VPTTGRRIRTPAGGGIEHDGSCCIDGDRPAGSLEGPLGSPRETLSFDAVRPPRPVAVSPNTMSDTRFPAAIDTLGFVDSRLENATVYWDTAAGCPGLVSSARACRSTRSGTKSRVGLCSNLAHARYGLRWEDAEVAEDAGVEQARMLVGLLRDEIAEISDKLKAPPPQRIASITGVMVVVTVALTALTTRLLHRVSTARVGPLSACPRSRFRCALPNRRRRCAD